MDVNNYQVGGNHYISDYQHWDFVIDTNLHYLLACATKYIARWRKKNGIEDLKKPLHYLAKAEDAGIKSPSISDTCFYLDKFIRGLCSEDAEIIVLIMTNEFNNARIAIEALILKHEDEGAPTSSYTNQDR